jgi:hypothetical protein
MPNLAFLAGEHEQRRVGKRSNCMVSRCGQGKIVYCCRDLRDPLKEKRRLMMRAFHVPVVF